MIRELLIRYWPCSLRVKKDREVSEREREKERKRERENREREREREKEREKERKRERERERGGGGGGREYQREEEGRRLGELIINYDDSKYEIVNFKTFLFELSIEYIIITLQKRLTRYTKHRVAEKIR